MIKKIILTVVLIAGRLFAINAQTTIDLEAFSLDPESYYNGSTDHSGTIGSTETFEYSEDAATFSVTYTQENGYGYWSGFAYSNQTDLTTADHTNYSAFSPTGGGAGSSENYILAFSYGAGISIDFDQAVNLSSMEITNSVWAYKFMTGEDGTGHEYEAGDYFTLTVKGKLEDGSFTTPIAIPLADYTNGNTIIIGDWTSVDLSSLDNVVGLHFILEALDTWTPSYFCLDNLVYKNSLSTNKNLASSFSVYPNPAKNTIRIKNAENASIIFYDISGNIILTINDYTNKIIDISNLKSGVYYIKVENRNHYLTKKLIIK